MIILFYPYFTLRLFLLFFPFLAIANFIEVDC